MIFSKLRVLIVDDEALMRTFVAELLNRLGIHQIEEAKDGKSALVALIKFQPDLILSDIHMDPMDGVEFVRQLRQLPNRLISHTRVIFMTADHAKETLHDALPLGIKGYIIKPPAADTLKARIEAAMR